MPGTHAVAGTSTVARAHASPPETLAVASTPSSAATSRAPISTASVSMRGILAARSADPPWSYRGPRILAAQGRMWACTHSLPKR